VTPSLTIDGHRIAADAPVFIIAEAGVNHNGDPAMAAELIRAACRTGADCVKFQTFKAERVVTAAAPKARYQLGTTDPAESQLDMLRKLELGEPHYRTLLDLARAEGIACISTPYNEEDVDFLDALGISAFKLASISCAEPSFLRYVAEKGRPIILSTGMATLDEVRSAVAAIHATGNPQLVLLQCTTNYPSRIEDTNLRAMLTLRDATGVLAGYSDHTPSHTACIAAVALGACMIEKHFTLDKSLPGPDQSTSCDPAEFTALVRAIRDTELALGHGRKEPAEIETINAIGMRRSIAARVNIPIGTTLTAAMLTLKRPATGLAPVLIDQLIGRTATREIAADELLAWESVQ